MPINAQIFMQQLRSFVPKHCENCGERHSEIDFSFVGQKESSYVFQISCTRCGSVQIIRMQPGVPGVAIQKVVNNTDVRGGQELAKFAGKPQIGKEEALEVYMEMENVNTLDDFLKLIDDRNSELDL